MDRLVEFLSNGRHPVRASRVESAAALRESIERDFILIKFTDTNGGTELGVPLDKTRSQIGNANFAESSGEVELVGKITLNYVPVEVSAKIDVATLEGTGQLTVLG